MKGIIKIVMFLAFLAGGLCCQAAETAQQVLAKATKQISGGVKADFTISGSRTMKGSFTASGSKFHLVTADMQVWYNGSHMWTYNASTKETTKVRPTASELAESNPMLFVSRNANAFKASFGKAGSGEKVLILVPKASGTGIQRAVLTLNASTLKPKKLAMRINNQTITVTFSSFSTGVSVAASAFEYPSSKFKGVKVINL